MATTYTENYNLGMQLDTTDKFEMAIITDNMVTIDNTLHALDGDIDALTTSLADEESARQTHEARTDNPHAVTAVQLGAATAASLAEHTGNTENPHSVTCLQIGAAAASDLTSHTSSTSNPHGTTATQVGAYTKAEINALLASAVIPGSADLNEYTTEGKYFVRNASDAASLTNAPVSVPFGLVVEKLHLLGCVQKVTPYGGISSASVPIMYARYCFFYNSTTWRYGDWYVLAQGQAVT